MTFVLPLLSLFFLFAVTAGAKTIYVPADYWTIQEAIDGAADGDHIMVRPGVYAENLDLGGKSIALESEKGPEVTFIDGNSAGSVIRYDNGEGAGSVLRGFTITNGLAQYGAGIYCEGNTDLLVTGNIIRENRANYIHWAFGGGILCEGTARIMITGNRITANHVHSSGGPVNDGYGAGIYCFNSSSTRIANNIISENSITSNRSSGGGIYCHNSSLTLFNNTILDNEVYSQGGGIACYLSTVDVANTILWGNDAPLGPEVSIGSATPHFDISYCDVLGGDKSVHVEPGCTMTWGAGMIESDPLLIEPAIGDYHISYESPCRNAGSVALLPPDIVLDFEHDPRVHDGAIDIGADEYHNHLYLTGLAVPGMGIDIRIVGEPGVLTTRLLVGRRIQDPPRPTPHGDLYLTWPVRVLEAGPIPASGVLVVPKPIPMWWKPQEEHPVQALVGPLTGQAELTNLMLLTVR